MTSNNIPTLTLTTDTDCVFYLDGVKQLQLMKGMSHELPMASGKYTLNFVSLDNPDDNLWTVFEMSEQDVVYEVKFCKKVENNKNEIKKHKNTLPWIVGTVVLVALVVFVIVKLIPSLSKDKPEESEPSLTLDESEPEYNMPTSHDTYARRKSTCDNVAEADIDNGTLSATAPAARNEEPRKIARDELADVERYYKAKRYSECLPLAKKYAELGYAEAQFYLANMYRRGYGVQKDTAAALMWYRKAAAQDHPVAQCSIGYFYNYGYGVPQDYCEAVKWYSKSASQGYAIAQCDLALCYEYGDCVEINYYEAKKWYQKAANQGDKQSKDALVRIQMKIDGKW